MPQGTLELIEPLDYLILDQLPIEGTMFAGAYPEGTTVLKLREIIAGGKLASSTISQRVRYMATYEMVVKVKGLGQHGRYVWQRTQKGDAMFKEWRARNGSSN